MFNKALLVATVATLAFSSAAFAGKKQFDAFEGRSTAIQSANVETNGAPVTTQKSVPAKAHKANKKAAHKGHKKAKAAEATK